MQATPSTAVPSKALCFLAHHPCPQRRRVFVAHLSYQERLLRRRIWIERRSNPPRGEPRYHPGDVVGHRYERGDARVRKNPERFGRRIVLRVSWRKGLAGNWSWFYELPGLRYLYPEEQVELILPRDPAYLLPDEEAALNLELATID